MSKKEVSPWVLPVIMFLYLPSVWLNGIIIQKTWNWFAVPLSDKFYDATATNGVCVFVLAQIARYVLFGFSSKTKIKDTSDAIVILVAAPAVLLGLIWTIHKMIEWGVM